VAEQQRWYADYLASFENSDDDVATGRQ